MLIIHPLQFASVFHASSQLEYLLLLLDVSIPTATSASGQHLDKLVNVDAELEKVKKKAHECKERAKESASNKARQSMFGQKRRAEFDDRVSQIVIQDRYSRRAWVRLASRFVFSMAFLFLATALAFARPRATRSRSMQQTRVPRVSLPAPAHVRGH